MTETIIGVDLGGTQIRVVLADEEGTVLARYRALTAPEDGTEAVLGRIVAGVRAVSEQSTLGPPQGIGICSPGPLDPVTGVVFQAPNLGWENVPLKSMMEERTGLPVVLGNDANVATLAEWQFGAGRGINDLVYMTVSTGIGSGIISGGHLLLGSHGLAGEVGHTTVEALGPRCKCGNIGCLEVLAAGPAIAARAIAGLHEGQASIIRDLVHGDFSQVTAEVVANAAQKGDAFARSVVDTAAFYIGVASVNLIHLLEPELILIGGGVARMGDLLFDTIRSTVRERAMPCMADSVRIEPAALGGDAGVLGAIALFREYGRN